MVEAHGQDWYHESCLDLRPLPSKRDPDRVENSSEVYEDDEEEDDEVLIPSDTYDGLICAKCVAKHSLLRERAGRPGWMTIERLGSGMVVRSRDGAKGPKRSLDGSDEPDAKRVKLEVDNAADAEKSNDHPGELHIKADQDDNPRDRGAGDVFLAFGVRDQLKKELDVGSGWRPRF